MLSDLTRLYTPIGPTGECITDRIVHDRRSVLYSYAGRPIRCIMSGTGIIADIRVIQGIIVINAVNVAVTGIKAVLSLTFRRFSNTAA